MKLLFLLYNLMSAMSYYIPQTNIIDTPFMIMSNQCVVSPNQKYSCSDIPDILNIDPDKQKDIDYVCNCSRTTGFTNEQLANLSTTRLHDFGLYDCNLTVLNNLGNVQFKNQCPIFYKKECSTRNYS